MRFPFFKTNTKIETREPIKTPAATGNKLAATQRIPLPALVNPRINKPATPTLAPVTKPTGPTVSLKISSVAPQIPTQVYSAQGQTLLATANMNVPVSLILPQLASGKVSITLRELLACFPSEI